MKFFTDIFIRRPVLGLVVNLVILIAGFQAIRTLVVRQYPRSDNAAVTVKTVYVGRAAAMSSTNSMQPSRVTLNAGTAGLGIPRGSINHLNHLNSEVVKHGSAQVRPAPQFGTQPAARSAAGPAMRGGSSAPQRGSMSSAPPARPSSPPPAHSGGGAPVHR